jgi:hypothetical protein
MASTLSFFPPSSSKLNTIAVLALVQNASSLVVFGLKEREVMSVLSRRRK